MHYIIYQENANWNKIVLNTYEDGPNPEHWQHQIQMMMWSKKHSYLLLMQCMMQCKDSSVISYQIKHTFII